MEVQQNSISLQMSSPKHMDAKVNSNVKPYCESPTKSYFSNYQMLSSSPNSINKMNSYSMSPIKKNSPLVKLMDSETVQNTQWNNYSNMNNNYKESSSPNSEKNILNNLNMNTNFKDVFDSLSKSNNNNNNNNETFKFSQSPSSLSFKSFDNNFIDFKPMKSKVNSSEHHHIPETSSDFFVKKSIKNHYENETNEKNLSQLSYQLSKASLNNNTNDIIDHSSEEKKVNINDDNTRVNNDTNTNENIKNDTNDTTKIKSLTNNFKTMNAEAIADIVFKKQEVHKAEKMNINSEKMDLQKSLYSCQLSLSPKEKVLNTGMMKTNTLNFGPKKSVLTKEDFESTKVIKENARKMLVSREPRKPAVRKPRNVKFSGENEECPFKRFEAPVSVTTSPIFLVNSTIKPFLETRCNLTTFTEFKQRMIIKKPILIEKAGLLIEESEKMNGHLAYFIKNADVKKEHGVFKSRPSHVPYGPSTNPLPLFASGEKDKIRVVIQVQNLAFEKEIYVRYTFNNWQTSKDVPAKYLNSLNVTSYISKKFHDSTSIYPNASMREKNTTGIDDSADSKIVSQSVDRFVADIDIPSYIMDFMEFDNNFFNRGGSEGYNKNRRRYSQSLGEEWDNDVINKCTLKFAAFYRVNGQEYWENNNSLNYTIDISRVLYIPTKKVYTRSRTPEIIKSRMVNFTDEFYGVPKRQKEHGLKSVLKYSSGTGDINTKTSSQKESESLDKKLLAKFELREKCIRETIQKELCGTAFLKHLGVNPTILNTIINSNRVSTRNNILKMLMYYQKKAGITNPICIPLEKETSKIEGNH